MSLDQTLDVDELLVNVLIKCTGEGLSMAGLKPVPVGVSKILRSGGNVTAIVGFVGPYNGSMMVGTSWGCARFMSSRMLNEPLEGLEHQVLDSLCEIANIITGQVKAVLSTTEYRFDRVSVPSVIVGDNYSISPYRGMVSVSVEFQLPDEKLRCDASTFTVNLSLTKM